MMGIGDYSTIVMIAFIGSLGHCIGMCGGFVIAYASTKIDPSMSKGQQLLSHSAYNGGRVFSYSVMGIIFGALGSLFMVTPQTHGSILIFAGIVMILTALGMLGLSSMIHLLEHSFSSWSIFKKLFSLLVKSRSLGSFFGLGVLNGLFPCGFVFFFLAKAIATGSWLQGGIVMGIFGLATIPVLGLLGMSVGFFKEFAFRQIMNRLAAVAIGGYGALTVYYGLSYFFDLPI